MKLIVGLGNPGAKYRQTRHNVGFEVLAELARRHGGGKPKVKFDAELVDVQYAGEKLLLVAPMTYMNESGRAARQVSQFYDVPAEDLLVICDDMNLETGRLRLRASGSAGGQKGLADIIRHLGTEDVPRLRIGIGQPPGQMSGSDYVLGKFTKPQREEIDPAILNAADGVERWVNDGIQLAMNTVNASSGDDD